MTFLEAQQDLCRKLNISHQDLINNVNDLFTLDDIKEWINFGTRRAWDYARWICSEEAVHTQAITGQDYYDYPNNFISDSIFILQVNHKAYDKKRFEDYQKYIAESVDGKDLIYSDYNRFFFINPRTLAHNDKITIWGKKRVPKLINSSDLLPFSPDANHEENSGNEAIVRIAYGIALSSDKKKEPARGTQEEQIAYQMLEIIARREREEQVQYQVKNRPFFDVPNFFN